MIKILRPIWPVVTATLLCAACGSGGDCLDELWPGASGNVLYVGKCAGATSDGSRDNPYASVAAAAKAASAGSTVVVGAGTWAESVELPAGVTLIGIMGQTVLTPPPGNRGIRVVGTGGYTEVRNLVVRGASDAGIYSQGTSLSVFGCEVSGTLAHNLDTSHGAGIALQGCSVAPLTSSCPSLQVVASRVHDNQGVGIAAEGAWRVSVRGSIAGSPRSSADRLPTTLGAAPNSFASFAPNSAISGNGGGGILVAIGGLPAGDGAASVQVAISNSLIQGNAQAGVVAWGSGDTPYTMTIDNTLITGSLWLTTAGAGDSFASGVVAYGGASTSPIVSHLLIGPGTVLAGNARAGLLVYGTSPVEAIVRGDVTGNQGGGIWAIGAGATVELRQEGRVSDNLRMGIGGVDGAQVLVREKARVMRTLATSFKNPQGTEVVLGDGCGVFNGARLTINDAHFANSARSHIMAHHPAVDQGVLAGFSIQNSQFEGGQYGVAINADAAPQLPSDLETALTAAGNTFANMALPVQVDADLCVEYQEPFATKSYCP